jgi:hypothetical protein
LHSEKEGIPKEKVSVQIRLKSHIIYIVTKRIKVCSYPYPKGEEKGDDISYMRVGKEEMNSRLHCNMMYSLPNYNDHLIAKNAFPWMPVI